MVSLCPSGGLQTSTLGLRSQDKFARTIQCLRMVSPRCNTINKVRATDNRSQKEKARRRVIQTPEAFI